MAVDGLSLAAVARADLTSWDRSDAWLAMMAGLLEETADECEGEPALGMWVLRDGQLIVGCVGILRHPRTARLELCRLHVRPECRRRGLSKRLIRHALDHAHAHSPEAVTAQVRADNAPAKAALTASGFREVSRSVRRSDGKIILLLEEAREPREP